VCLPGRVNEHKFTGIFTRDSHFLALVFFVVDLFQLCAAPVTCLHTPLVCCLKHHHQAYRGPRTLCFFELTDGYVDIEHTSISVPNVSASNHDPNFKSSRPWKTEICVVGPRLKKQECTWT
jgi:hypothetical protein